MEFYSFNTYRQLISWVLFSIFPQNVGYKLTMNPNLLSPRFQPDKNYWPTFKNIIASVPDTEIW